jgi:hypothetical protein
VGDYWHFHFSSMHWFWFEIHISIFLSPGIVTHNSHSSHNFISLMEIQDCRNMDRKVSPHTSYQLLLQNGAALLLGLGQYKYPDCTSYVNVSLRPPVMLIILNKI